MGFLTSLKNQLTPTAIDSVDVSPGRGLSVHSSEHVKDGDSKMPVETAADATSTAIADAHNIDEDNEKQLPPVRHVRDAGVSAVEAAQAIWGKRGRILIIVGLCLVMVIYELDNSTVYIYNNYSTSAFSALSELSTLSTATTIVFAVVKPPLAKISNIIGRGQTYILTISFYIIGYILMASATNINRYAAGLVFYTMGQSGTNLMNDVTTADITSARWRGFAIGLLFWPYLITPWISAYIVDSVVAPNGIGWRWGIGMFAILMPFCASFIITTLLYYQHRAKKMNLVLMPTQRMTVYEFCSQIDLGGIVLFVAGLAMLLIPLTLAATSPQQWRTPYLDALIALGGLLLIALPFYEAYVAVNPVVPLSYFKNLTISLCLVLVALDSAGFSCTHTYLYSWGSVAHNLSARVDTFYVQTNGVAQCLFAILAGLVMAKTRSFKYLAIVGAVIRTIGYGIMLRLRGANNSNAELFVVQAIQGMGSGIIQGILLVPAQISVPHAQLAQITALVVTTSFVGSSIGACIAGGIYTNTLKGALRSHLGSAGLAANETLIDTLYNSITGEIPVWGTVERTAINMAYSDVLRYMTYTALGSSIPGLFLTWLFPNIRLPDLNNLVEG